MKDINPDDLAKFAGLVAKVWNDPKLAQNYKAAPDQVLAAHGITLAQGVPTPVIPDRPAGDLGKAWQNMAFENWDLTVTPLGPGAGGTNISVSTLACVACPLSSFSSLSN